MGLAGVASAKTRDLKNFFLFLDLVQLMMITSDVVLPHFRSFLH